MRLKKGILLFEVAFIVLLVSIISLYLFAGYGVFLKAGRKSLDYLKLINLSEEKNWDLQMIELDNNGVLPLDLEKESDFKEASFNWQIEVKDWQLESENIKLGNLKECVLKVNYEGKRRLSFDTVMFFIVS